ncbi:ATPase [Phaeobacter sp. QD34_3]|uniref:ATPase n=1 Tax=unclassified Phaeobacter TaxID=2621772 RepID=UPI00237F4AB5|nr:MULTISPECIES: ATPase [unclassified Phaeobacter]MDE4131710.1 ATPase [Phaeobacter sp. QD34_3]MDE4135201.1 ATPase [Phaeobacter sp. QD34_24]MDE4174522.1 ATPase [Phaeobacter sp. PT47_59]
MLYSSAQAWRDAPNKRVLFFGMSGLGKTYVSNILRGAGGWFHYSIDYRIGTRYMGEYIADNAKAEAMKVPFLRDLLLSDSIYIGSNITFDNLTPVSSYLGKPGDPAKGGLAMEEYRRRQDQFRQAEIHALLDTEYFIDRAGRLYDYPHFICDTGGSICEWVDPEDPNDPVLSELAKHTLMVWIKGDDAHTEELVRRFDRAPKPMSYQPEFLTRVWEDYLSKNSLSEADVDPDAFIRWTYAQALAHRQPRYQAMAQNWGITVTADQISAVKDEAGFIELIAATLEAAA